jgi:hypothetical protein
MILSRLRSYLAEPVLKAGESGARIFFVGRAVRASLPSLDDGGPEA